MLLFTYIFIYIVVFAIGAVIGSFLNVLIYRLPRGLSFVRGFSFCPACRNRLFPKDLVPIFSWLFLRQKCRYCGAAIPARYLLVELLSGFAALFSWIRFAPLFSRIGFEAPSAFFDPRDFAFAILCFAVLACLIAIAWIDFDTMEIPDSLNIAIAVCGALVMILGALGALGALGSLEIAGTHGTPGHGLPLSSHFIGIAVCAVPLFIISLFVEGAFGFGDVKLMAAAGLFLGWQSGLAALFIGIIIGGVQGIFLLATRRKTGKDHFAFGPALCMGIAAAIFFGGDIVGWYMRFF